MTTSAAAIRSGVLDSDDWKAWALPWKLVASEGGLPSSFSTCWMAATACPIAIARREVERDRHRRELALMVDHERRYLHRAIDQGAQRHLLSSR